MSNMTELWAATVITKERKVGISGATKGWTMSPARKATDETGWPMLGTNDATTFTSNATHTNAPATALSAIWCHATRCFFLGVGAGAAAAGGETLSLRLRASSMPSLTLSG